MFVRSILLKILQLEDVATGVYGLVLMKEYVRRMGHAFVIMDSVD